MPIKILSEQVASQIAAGEVIERPASVVKELVENALDAGAHQITLKVEDGGRTLIEVSDNGCGIPLDELPLALARHATSKLDSADDLFNIRTLGFRGEALASIASVARVTIISAASGASTGGKLLSDGGSAQPVEQVGVPTGTVIRVEDLFFNVPARQKFLKKDATEKRRIDALVTRYAMAYPSVRFHLFQNNRPVLQTSGQGDCREVLAALYGPQVARQVLEIRLEQGDIHVAGYISPIELTRSNRREITCFVNGRWVQDAALVAALMQAYHNLLNVGRYPMAVLFIELPPAQVDVNVHPAKSEIRFAQPDIVFSTVQRAVRRGLLAHAPIPGETTEFPAGRPAFPTASRPASLGWEMASELQQKFPEKHTIPPIPQQPTLLPLTGPEQPLMRAVGQVGSAYLVAEAPDGLYLVDQNRAHARILFDRLLENQRSGQPAEEFASPLTLHLDADKITRLNNILGNLVGLGFEIESFGPETYRIRAMPHALESLDAKEIILKLLSLHAEGRAKAPERNDPVEQLAADISIISALSTGVVLDMETQQNLLTSLQSSASPRTCPYGRPTMIHLSVDLLARQFDRRISLH